jgi:quercetin dioxygenase-like cupin family protein
VRHWDASALEVEPSHPQILSSTDDTRAVVLHVPAGESLNEHQVHERAWVVVIAGELDVSAGDESVAAGPGHVFEFEPAERHELRARADARILLLLTPWPGDGHPGAMPLAGKDASAQAAAGGS